MKNILLIAIVLLILGCSKENRFTKEVTSPVFQCCNVWEDFNTIENDAETAISEFMDSQNIPYRDLEINNIGLIALCTTCCKCPSDEEVRMTVRPEDLEVLSELGFEE